MSIQRRLKTGGEIDRSRRLDFSFDGLALSGYAGDTIASALLAADVPVVARSFKYHRPRGLLGAQHEEPNAILDLRLATRHDPNARATLEPLRDGMRLTSIHARGTARRDLLAIIDRFARFIPAGFYYKTFMWPNWHLYEPSIRKMAGLGRVDATSHVQAGPHRHLNVDLCIVGAGAAGLAAARAGLRSGRSVLLVEQRTRAGGALLWHDTSIEGQSGAQWAEGVTAELTAGGARVLTCTTAVGLYDHNAIVLHERGLDADSIWQIRARQIVLATGVTERPLLFGDNDRPGVMLADAALEDHAPLCRGGWAAHDLRHRQRHELRHSAGLRGSRCTLHHRRCTSAVAGDGRCPRPRARRHPRRTHRARARLVPHSRGPPVIRQDAVS
jgi:sarcosine oxidase subunit alpha